MRYCIKLKKYNLLTEMYPNHYFIHRFQQPTLKTWKECKLNKITPNLGPNFVEKLHEAVVDHESYGNVKANPGHAWYRPFVKCSETFHSNYIICYPIYSFFLE